MSVLKDFALPDLGEGLTESEIVSWHVAVGDRVELNQILGEVETAKALVELPSPFEGTVSRLYAEPGTTVAVGSPIVAFELDDDGAGGEGDAPAAEGADAVAAAAAAGGRGTQARQPVLVGYGPPVENGSKPIRRRRAAGGNGPADDAEQVGKAVDESAPASRAVQVADSNEAAGGSRPRSTPPVRKLAHDLGIDLRQVTGTGEDGLITRADVESFITEGGGESQSIVDAQNREDQVPAVALGASARPRETRIPIAGVRKRTAEAMVLSAFSAPQATEFLTVDVTATLELLDTLKSAPEFRDKRMSVMTMAAKALCVAVARTPEINSRWHGEAGEIVQFGYVNLGIAAATKRGLLVPNVKDADRMTLAGLADSISQLVDEARAGRTAPARLTGGTITITNVGVFGVDSGTPILNPGEAAILALGAVRRRPWEYRGELALRQVMTLSVSFDHRLVDGEQGSRFLSDVGAILAEPGIALSMV